jgi:hypothetical protein
MLVKLNIASLSAGAYTVKALTPYGVATRSIVIE